MPQRASIFEKQITKTIHLDYLLWLPREYRDDGSKRWPLILFLHGAGERGTDINQIKVHGIPKIVEQHPDFPFIAVSPQCPPGTSWAFQIDALDALLDEVVATYTIDTDRVYLTGLSMGGNGSWHLATNFPDRFAAVVPICGWGDWFAGFPDKVCVLKNVPVWALHGDADEIVPVGGSQILVDTLQACGGNVRLTIYPGVGHDSWTATYDNPELYTWLLSHKRGSSG